MMLPVVSVLLNSQFFTNQHPEEGESLTQKLTTYSDNNWPKPNVLVFCYSSPKSLEELLILTAQSKATLKSLNIYWAFYVQDVS